MGAPNLDGFPSLVEQVCKRLTMLTGNVMGQRQKPMVEARLRRRLLELRVSAQDYPAYWEANRESEDEILVGLLTTHFTSFFREFLHFEWLLDELPAMVKMIRKEGRDELKIWSSACSRGQEVWSLAMWLHHHLPKIDPTMKWSVYGSDIDQASVQIAINGVYHSRELATAPRHLWESVWQRGKEDLSDWYKVKKVIRDHCSFGTENLLAPKNQSNLFDVIFCRNVLIYFDEANQKKVVANLLKQLRPGGTIISGVSESLTNLGLGLTSLAPSVYVKEAAVPVKRETSAPRQLIPKPLRVLCIDDSSTVLTIMKKLLQGDEFVVVGTAKDGEEGQKLFHELKPDVITLDLHMPVMDGFRFVNETGIARKTPIVVVSTVERQNASLVHPLFDAGVCDFLEKPTFENLSQIGEELKQKLKMSWWAKNRNLDTVSVSAGEKKKPHLPGRIVLNAGISDRDAIVAFLKSGDFSRDEVCINLGGESFLWEDWALSLKGDFMTHNLQIGADLTWRKDSLVTIFFQFKAGSVSVMNKAIDTGCHIVLEDGEWNSETRSKSFDMYPVTSFSYMAERALGGR